MLLNKIMGLNSYKDLRTLAAGYELPSYTAGQKEGRDRLRNLAFIKIEGLQELIKKKNYFFAKKVLLGAAGDRIKFAKLFSKNPFTLKRTPYWRGSYVYALMDTFPELNLNPFDFPKLPRHSELVFEEQGGRNFLLEQAVEKFGVTPEKARGFLIHKREQGIRIFTNENVTGRNPKGAYKNRAQRIRKELSRFSN